MAPASHRPAPDASARRVLAHPLRSRVLAELRVHGEATASELARALGTHSGATSYHLRRLAQVGLVVEAPPGPGRRRPWRVGRGEQPSGPVSVAGESGGGGADGDPDPDDLAASAWLARDYLAHFGQRAGRWLEEADAWPGPWRAACGLEDHLVLVSAEQLTALHEELREVLERYRRVGQGNPAAKRVSVYTCPLPVDGPPRRP